MSNFCPQNCISHATPSCETTLEKNNSYSIYLRKDQRIASFLTFPYVFIMASFSDGDIYGYRLWIGKWHGYLRKNQSLISQLRSGMNYMAIYKFYHCSRPLRTHYIIRSFRHATGLLKSGGIMEGALLVLRSLSRGIRLEYHPRCRWQ